MVVLLWQQWPGWNSLKKRTVQKGRAWFQKSQDFQYEICTWRWIAIGDQHKLSFFLLGFVAVCSWWIHRKFRNKSVEQVEKSMAPWPDWIDGLPLQQVDVGTILEVLFCSREYTFALNMTPSFFVQSKTKRTPPSHKGFDFGWQLFPSWMLICSKGVRVLNRCSYKTLFWRIS